MAINFLSGPYNQAITWLTASKVAFLVTNKFLFAVLILFASIIIGKMFLFFIEKIVLVFTSRTKTKLDDLIIEKTRRPLFYVLILAGVYLSISSLKVEDTIVSIANKLIGSLVVLILAIALNRTVGVLIGVLGKRWAERTESTMDDELLPLFSKVSVAIIFTLTLIFILKVWKVDITGLLAGLGIVGLAIGFAFQDSLKNIFGDAHPRFCIDHCNVISFIIIFLEFIEKPGKQVLLLRQLIHTRDNFLCQSDTG